MAKSRGFCVALMLAAFFGLGARAASDHFGGGPLRIYLPADNAASGWTRDGEFQEYEGEDLYAYIDGGAEIYQEYGFRRVILQDYKNAGKRSISLEIFEMETPDAAFGIFTFKRSGSGKALPLGAGAELEAYYLNFWKGRFLVTLTGFDEAAETIDGLSAMAGAVDSMILDGGEAPGLVAVLPAEGLRPGSVKYLKGLLGLNNVYAFYTARGLAFREAVRGLYESGQTLILFDHGSDEARASSWLELRSYLERSERFERTGSERADIALFRDGRGRFVAFAESGPRLVIGIGQDPDAALDIVRRAR
jgi:hypothetical protein